MQPRRAGAGELNERPSRRSRQRAMYEDLMDDAVRQDNCERALKAVIRNKGAAGIDRMNVEELEEHLQRHWPKIRAKLLSGAYVPSPVKRVEIPKPNLRDAGAGYSHGAGPVHPAAFAAGDDADL